LNGEVQLVPSVPDAFARLVAAALAGPRPDRFSLFLSGGSTARACYERLAQVGSAGSGVPWSTVDVYLGDERCVPPDDPDSNHRMVVESLLDHIGPVGSDHLMYRSGSPSSAATDYQAVISPLPMFDLVHLGLGPDGHCASLFPGSAALDVVDPAVLVVANKDPQAVNPHDRITLTYPGIARARLVVFTVSGTSKREAFAAIVAGVDLPAARVTADQVVWLVDEDAADDTPLPATAAS
jgi:6-phosphogluconolactonase